MIKSQLDNLNILPESSLPELAQQRLQAMRYFYRHCAVTRDPPHFKEKLKGAVTELRELEVRSSRGLGRGDASTPRNGARVLDLKTAVPQCARIEVDQHCLS